MARRTSFTPYQPNLEDFRTTVDPRILDTWIANQVSGHVVIITGQSLVVLQCRQRALVIEDPRTLVASNLFKHVLTCPTIAKICRHATMHRNYLESILGRWGDSDWHHQWYDVADFIPFVTVDSIHHTLLDILGHTEPDDDVNCQLYSGCYPFDALYQANTISDTLVLLEDTDPSYLHDFDWRRRPDADRELAVEPHEFEVIYQRDRLRTCTMQAPLYSYPHHGTTTSATDTAPRLTSIPNDIYTTILRHLHYYDDRAQLYRTSRAMREALYPACLSLYLERCRHHFFIRPKFESGDEVFARRVFTPSWRVVISLVLHRNVTPPLLHPFTILAPTDGVYRWASERTLTARVQALNFRRVGHDQPRQTTVISFEWVRDNAPDWLGHLDTTPRNPHGFSAAGESQHIEGTLLLAVRMLPYDGHYAVSALVCSRMHCELLLGRDVTHCEHLCITRPSTDASRRKPATPNAWLAPSPTFPATTALLCQVGGSPLVPPHEHRMFTCFSDLLSQIDNEFGGYTPLGHTPFAPPTRRVHARVRAIVSIDQPSLVLARIADINARVTCDNVTELPMTSPHYTPGMRIAAEVYYSQTYVILLPDGELERALKGATSTAEGELSLAESVFLDHDATTSDLYLKTHDEPAYASHLSTIPTAAILLTAHPAGGVETPIPRDHTRIQSLPYFTPGMRCSISVTAREDLPEDDEVEVSEADVGEEDDEEAEDAEDGELDLAEQDAELAYGHEMRPFGVPNPNPYHPHAPLDPPPSSPPSSPPPANSPDDDGAPPLFPIGPLDAARCVPVAISECPFPYYNSPNNTLLRIRGGAPPRTTKNPAKGSAGNTPKPNTFSPLASLLADDEDDKQAGDRSSSAGEPSTTASAPSTESLIPPLMELNSVAPNATTATSSAANLIPPPMEPKYISPPTDQGSAQTPQATGDLQDVVKNLSKTVTGLVHDLDHQRAVQATLDYDLRIKLDQHSAEIHEALRYERQADKESQQRLTIELEMMRQLQDKKLDSYQGAMARQDKLQRKRESKDSEM